MLKKVSYADHRNGFVKRFCNTPSDNQYSAIGKNTFSVAFLFKVIMKELRIAFFEKTLGASYSPTIFGAMNLEFLNKISRKRHS